MRTLLVVGLLLLPLAAFADGYTAEVEAWRARREERLRRPDGWLTLAGLFWLREGPNRFGSGPDNDLVFPDKAPARLGVATVAEGKVAVDLEPGVLVNGQPAARVVLDPKAEEGATVLSRGSLSWYLLERGGRLGFRLKDRESPVLRDFRGTAWFPVDPAWRVTARLEGGPHRIAVPSVTGGTSQEESPGTLVFELEGRELRLDPVLEDGGLFVVFADATSGRETYGSGRFLSAEAPDAEGRTVLDFNRAYSPPCAFTPYATCPIPPAQNRLPVAIRAGEKAPAGH